MNCTLQELYMMSHSNYRIAIFYLVLSLAGWIGTSYYILSGFYVCAMYTSLQSLPEKLYQFIDLEKKRNCLQVFFLFFVGTCLACSVSICDGLYVLLEPINASLLLPTFNENQSSKQGGRVQENSAMLFLNWRPVKDTNRDIRGDIFQQIRT